MPAVNTCVSNQCMLAEEREGERERERESSGLLDIQHVKAPAEEY